MIHDILLSLLTPNVDTLPIAAFLSSEDSIKYLHPWEHKVLDNIVQIAVQHQSVCKFVQRYSTQSRCAPTASAAPAPSHPHSDPNASLFSTNADDEPLPRGLYLQAICEGVDRVLVPFRDDIADLERRYLQTPTHSLMFVYERIKAFQPLLTFLLGLLGGVRQQRLHGCALLQYLHRHSMHGNPVIMKAIQDVQLSVHRVFLKQLTQWVMHGRFVDAYSEFFIQLIEQPARGGAGGHGAHNGTFNTSHSGDAAVAAATAGRFGRAGQSASAAGGASAASAAALGHNGDLWRYEIGYDQLPPYFTPQWAEKVRFIGQTVVTFNLDPNSGDGGAASNDLAGRTAKASPSHGGGSDGVALTRETLWNDQEHVFVQQLRAICAGDRLHLHRYETVVDAIKVYVSGRLSQIAIEQADLVGQLRLIKDFYLLGRGEFFLEFIKQTRAVLEQKGKCAPTTAAGNAGGGTIIDEAMAKDIVTAFTTAANNINVVDDLEQFQLTVPLDALGAGTGRSSLNVSFYNASLDDQHGDSGAAAAAEAAAAAAAAVVGFIPSLTLRYRVRWPLHLLFSPRMIDGYNEMFRFLLQIKRIQYELQMVWCDHRERRVGRDAGVLQQLRNKLMFVVNNLQYYLQVDVLEAQFSVLMQTVQESRDFEHIQRAHTVFQANVLGLCFLLAGHEQQHQQHNANGGSVTMAAAMLNRTDVFGCADNPVLIILNKIMQRVLVFCELSMACSVPLTADQQRALRRCDDIFDGHVAELMRLLSGMRAGPSSAPLAQLLLRLDYNYWFSATEAQRAVAVAAADASEDAADERDGVTEAIRDDCILGSALAGRFAVDSFV